MGLGFKTNQAYTRWWEGRQQWENIMSNTREIFRALSAHAHEQDIVDYVGTHLIAFTICMKNMLRGVESPKDDEGIRFEVQACFPPGSEQQDFETLMSLIDNRTRCMWELQTVSTIVEAMVDNDMLKTQYMRDIMPKIASMNFSLSDCERINITPVPWTYYLHLRTLIIFYLLLLPMVFEKYDQRLFAYNVKREDTDLDKNGIPGIITVGFVAFISYAFLGLEQMANEVQRPFGWDCSDLPLEDYCRQSLKSIQRISMANHNNMEHRANINRLVQSLKRPRQDNENDDDDDGADDGD